MEPCHDFVGLRMQDEFASFEPDGRLMCDTTAAHDSPDVIKRQMLASFLPDVAVLAPGLASRGGIEHQLAQPLVSWSGHIVDIQ